MAGGANLENYRDNKRWDRLPGRSTTTPANYRPTTGRSAAEWGIAVPSDTLDACDLPGTTG